MAYSPFAVGARCVNWIEELRFDDLWWKAFLIFFLSSYAVVAECSDQLCADYFQENFELIAPELLSSAAQSIRLRSGEGTIAFQNCKETLLGVPILYFEQGTLQQRLAKITLDPIDSSNKVLKFQLTEPNVKLPSGFRKGRIQMSVYENVGLNDLSVSTKMRLGIGFQHIIESGDEINWLMISEFWSEPAWIGGHFPFRISVNLVRPSNSKVNGFYVRISAQSYNQVSGRWDNTRWKVQSEEAVIPIGEWVTITYRLKSDPKHGVFKMSIAKSSGATVETINVLGATVDPRSTSGLGVTHFNPIKLYTSESVIDLASLNRGVLEVFWDDLEIWACAEPASLALGFETNFGCSQ